MACSVTWILNRAPIRRPVTPHVLRHTFSVTAIHTGISLPALQRLLGHGGLNLAKSDVLAK
jgi:site-specific recombinase XerD